MQNWSYIEIIKKLNSSGVFQCQYQISTESVQYFRRRYVRRSGLTNKQGSRKFDVLVTVHRDKFL